MGLDGHDAASLAIQESRREAALAPPVPPSTAGLLSVTEAARWAGISRHTLNGWITCGRLPAVKVGYRRWVHPSDISVVQADIHSDGVVPAWRRDKRRSGMRLRALREAAGLTQLELEMVSGLSHEAISLLELGRRAPLGETVRKLARALRIHPIRFVASEEIGAAGLPVVVAAARLGVPAARVRTWLKLGKLEGVKVSGEWRVPVPSVIQLERSGRMRGRSGRLDPRFRG